MAKNSEVSTLSSGGNNQGADNPIFQKPTNEEVLATARRGEAPDQCLFMGIRITDEHILELAAADSSDPVYLEAAAGEYFDTYYNRIDAAASGHMAMLDHEYRARQYEALRAYQGLHEAEHMHEDFASEKAGKLTQGEITKAFLVSGTITVAIGAGAYAMGQMVVSTGAFPSLAGESASAQISQLLFVTAPIIAPIALHLSFSDEHRYRAKEKIKKLARSFLIGGAATWLGCLGTMRALTAGDVNEVPALLNALEPFATGLLPMSQFVTEAAASLLLFEGLSGMFRKNRNATPVISKVQDVAHRNAEQNEQRVEHAARRHSAMDNIIEAYHSGRRRFIHKVKGRHALLMKSEEARVSAARDSLKLVVTEGE